MFKNARDEIFLMNFEYCIYIFKRIIGEEKKRKIVTVSKTF